MALLAQPNIERPHIRYKQQPKVRNWQEHSQGETCSMLIESKLRFAFVFVNARYRPIQKSCFIIKTRILLEALTEHVKANHEYDVPEVIAMPIVGGSPQYLEWLKNSTRDN
ncbi:hypothetical protein HAX54_043841 [Datura stramonium]|uniref:Uncharacterized protein n=1 Tax=Datura stramonium TaxID=4076 RepID=A0ABS8SP46_DATST|nr:hypothetical protein [Datura stramonium]